MKPSNQTSPTPGKLDYRSSDSGSVNELINQNIALIAELESIAKSKRTFADRIADAITGFCGRITFVCVHVVWFGIWIGSNLTHAAHFDPFPFNLLALILSVEAIFLLSFILMSENKQNLLTNRRNHLDLQINLLAEQENTKIMSMLLSIQEHLGILDDKPDTALLLEAAEPASMVQQIQDLIEDENNDSQTGTD